MKILLFLFSFNALAAFNSIPTAPVSVYGLPVTPKGSLVTSNGSAMGSSNVCLDGEILVWDSTEVDGVRCERKGLFARGGNIVGTFSTSSISTVAVTGLSVAVDYKAGDKYLVTVNQVVDGNIAITGSGTGTFGVCDHNVTGVVFDAKTVPSGYTFYGSTVFYFEPGGADRSIDVGLCAFVSSGSATISARDLVIMVELINE